MSVLTDVVAAIKAGGVTRAYKMNEVPSTATYPYAVAGLTSPDKVARTADGAGADLYRATVQFFGRDIDGVLDIADKGDLDGKYVTGRLIARDMATPPDRDPDDQGVVSILHTYRL
jgi:hypothetical protein